MNSAKLTGKTIRCDGNHGGPRCADPECWNDFLDHVDHTGQPIDPVDALRLSRWMHQATLQALGDVKRELAYYKAGEQPRVEDRDREIAELKQQIKAAPPAAPRGQTCATCRWAGERVEVSDTDPIWGLSYQVCDEPKLAQQAGLARPLTNEDGTPFGCTRWQSLPSAPAPASPEEK